MVYAVVSFVTRGGRARKRGESFGNTFGPGYSPERYKTAESYEMTNGSRGNSLGRRI